MSNPFREAYQKHEQEFKGLPRAHYWALYIATFGVPLGLVSLAFAGNYYFGA